MPLTVKSLVRLKGDQVGASAKWLSSFIRASANINLSPFTEGGGEAARMRASVIVDWSPFLSHQCVKSSWILEKGFLHWTSSDCFNETRLP